MEDPSDRTDPASGRAAQWQDLKLSGIRRRLTEVRNLLRQAAAVGLAQDVARIEQLAELHQQRDAGGEPKRRRYR